MKNFISLLLTLLLIGSNAAWAQEDKALQQIKAMLQRQTELWNEGDIEAFMQDYWKSDKLVFLSANGPVYGWQATLDRYLRAYPDRAAMGQLRFDLLNVDKRSRKVVTVIGQFHLQRTIGNLSGYFLLVCQKIKGKWKIVADHTSLSS